MRALEQYRIWSDDRVILNGESGQKSKDLTAGVGFEDVAAVAMEEAELGFPAGAIADFRREIRLPVALTSTVLNLFLFYPALSSGLCPTKINYRIYTGSRLTNLP